MRTTRYNWVITMDTAPQGKIGRYVIHGELGRGAMGIVYRAQDPAIGRTVAVKTIRIGQFNDEREIKHVQDRMMREAQAAGILSHTNIVTIYDIQHEEGTAYIFMEFVDGETLEKMLLADTPIDKQLIIHILKQAAEALDYAHQRGIVHRDVKPANIMVRRDGVAKIADFGIARMQSHSLTQAGQILGTPNYMSPEQISGKPVDGRADQYSLAVMLYEVLTGEKPFVADSLPTLLFRVVSEAPQPAPRLNPTLSPAIDDVLQRALSKAPEDRYPSCTEFVRSLERACQSAPGWTTLVRGGGLSQPTNAGFSHSSSPNYPSPYAPGHSPHPEPKPVVIPHQETFSRRPAAPVEPVEAVDPKPRKKKQKINMTAILVVAVLAAGIGGAGIVYKLMLDKQKNLQATTNGTGTTSPVPPPVEPPKTEPVKPNPPKAETPKPEPKKQADPPPVERPKPSSTPPPVANTNPAPPKSGGVMAVAIRTQPDGAKVIVDDGKTAPCTSPCLLELPHGRHTATMQLEPYRSEFRIFYVPQDTAISVNLVKRSGMLEVNSTPSGATISIDGVEQSQKTPARIPVIIGKHTVVVTLPGKPAYNQTFEMRSEATISLHPNWAN